MAIPTLFCHDDDDDNGPPRPNKTSNFCPDVVIVVVVSWVCSLRYFHNSTGDTRQKGLQDTIHTTTRACKSRPLFRGNPVRFHTRIASSAASALLVVLFVVLKTLSVEAAVAVVAVAGVVVVMDGLDGVIHDAVLMRVSDMIPYGQLVVRP